MAVERRVEAGDRLPERQRHGDRQRAALVRDLALEHVVDLDLVGLHVEQERVGIADERRHVAKVRSVPPGSRRAARRSGRPPWNPTGSPRPRRQKDVLAALLEALAAELQTLADLDGDRLDRRAGPVDGQHCPKGVRLRLVSCPTFFGLKVASNVVATVRARDLGDGSTGQDERSGRDDGAHEQLAQEVSSSGNEIVLMAHDVKGTRHALLLGTNTEDAKSCTLPAT